MKTLNILSPALLISLIISCEKIEKPVIPDDTEKLIEKFYPGDPAEFEISATFPDNTNTTRNILIEDFTGHLCNNCPAAAIIAKDIEANNLGRVFVIGVHAPGGKNSFQSVTKDYPTDFTTEAGTAYAKNIPGYVGNPSGLISRKNYDGKIWLFKESWGNATNAIKTSNKLIADIQIKVNHYPETGGVFVHYQVEAKQAIDTALKVIVLLVEKKVVSPQKLEDGTKKEDYEHHNVLSGIISGAYLDETDGSIKYSSFFGDNIGTLSNGEKKTGIAINGLNEMNTKRKINADGGNDLTVFALLVNEVSYEIYQVVTQDIEF